MLIRQARFSHSDILSIKPILGLLMSICMIGIIGYQASFDKVYPTRLTPVFNIVVENETATLHFLDSILGNGQIDFFSATQFSARKELEKNAVLFQQKKASKDRIQIIISETADRYQVDPAIIKAIVMAESSFNPKAESKVGARGLMQLMPRTAEYLGVKDSFNPVENIDAGVRYFNKLLHRFDHNIELALAAYNAGSRNVRKYGGIPPFKETKVYIKKVLAYYEMYKGDSVGTQSGCLYRT